MSNESNRESGLMEVGWMLPSLRHTARVWAISLSLLMVMAVVGCGGGGKTITPTPTPAVTIALGTVPSSLTVGQTYQFSATVSNTSNTAVTWAAGGVAGGNSTVGTISSSGLYTAPAMVPTPQSVNITAASQADSAKSVSASVTINISFNMNENTASILVTATHQFTATIAGTTNTAVTWTVNGIAGGNSTVGTISEAGLYTAPQVPPSPSTVTVTATSAAYTSTSRSIAVTVLPPPLTVSVNPSALDLQVNGTVQLTDTVTTTGNLPFSTAVTWGVKSPGNTGIAKYGYISSTGLYTAPATPPAGPLNPIPIYVTSQEDPTKFAISYVTVTKTPVLLTISTTTLANGVANSPYTATISAFGGAQPYVWSVPPNTLPPGLSINSSTGVISGTPTTAGNYPFVVTATDQTSPTHETATANLSITIVPQLSISTASLPSGSVGASYSASLTETGGVAPYTWAITSGTLPSGLTLTGNTITGTPATGTGSMAGQAYPLTFTVADSGTPQQTKTFSPTIIIYNGVVITTTSPINTAFVGQPYTFMVQAVGGVAPYTWVYTNLPSWLSATPSTVLTSTITGTPTTQAAVATFTVRVTDGNGVHYSVNLSITVSTAMSFPKPTLPAGSMNTPYTTTLTATGGLAPYTWSYTGLPSWLAATPSTTLSSTLAGTPSTQGSFGFTVKLADSSVPPQTQSYTLSSTVYTGLTITVSSLPYGFQGTPYSQQLGAAGGSGNYSWSLASGSLPTGFLPLPTSGLISGTPTATGNSSFTVQVTDTTTTKTATQPLSILITTALGFSTTTLPGGAVNTAYSTSLPTPTGGTAPLTYSVASGTLPAGLNLNTSTGAITGTPTAGGTSNFSVKVTDSSVPPPAQKQTQAFSISILGITTTSLPMGVLNQVYNTSGFQLSAAGGSGNYTWSLASGSLPTGFSALSSSGLISGTPTATGTFNFTVQVKDTSTNLTATQALSISISATAACTDSGSESLLSGQYAFALSGYNSTGFLGMLGSMTLDGSGHITAGTVDSNGALGVQSASITTSGSSYAVGSNHLGCATIVTPFGTFNTRFSLGSIASNVAAEGRVIEWETGSSAYIAAGEILKQTLPATLSNGNYVYELTGVFGSVHEYRAGDIGVITVSGGGFTDGEYDLTVGQGTHTNHQGTNGTFTAPNSTTGRYTTQTWLASAPTIIVNHVAYLVSGSQYLELTADPLSTLSALLIGKGQLQSGTLNNSSVSGNLVFYQSGLNSAGTGGLATLGLVNANGSGSLTVTIYEDDAGTWQTPQTPTCAYSVASNGKMTLSGAGCGSNPPVFYLSAANTAVMLGTDSSVAIGRVEPQTGAPFSISSLSGAFAQGTVEAVNQAAETGVAVVTLNGSGGVSVTNDATSTTFQNGDQTSTDTVMTVDSTHGTIITADHPGQIVGVIISGTKFVIVDNQGSTYPAVSVLKK